LLSCVLSAGACPTTRHGAAPPDAGVPIARQSPPASAAGAARAAPREDGGGRNARAQAPSFDARAPFHGPAPAAAIAPPDGEAPNAAAPALERDAPLERERRLDLVTIKLLVDPPKKAHVFWGVKDFGLAPVEIRRPRGSGPVDLVLRAPGFLTYHTRAFTDRDDTLSIHLAAESEAPHFFGYRPPDAKTLPRVTKDSSGKSRPPVGAGR
jgi:hypothetical protein